MTYDDTLLAYDYDIRDRSFWDWIKAHTTFLKPLHRYAGKLEVNELRLLFQGEDKKEDRELRLEIPVPAISEVHFGFDDVFERSEDRQLGLMDFEPIRVRWEVDNDVKTIYLFANFHHSKFGWRSSDNPQLFKWLQGVVQPDAGQENGQDSSLKRQDG